MAKFNYRQARVIISASATAILAVVLGMGLAADPGPRKVPQQPQVQGSIASQTYGGPACKSPVGRCFTATFKGSLQGSAEFVASQAERTAQSGVMRINGNFVINDERGRITCYEDSLLNAARGSDGEFVFLCDITGGTGKWAGASGYLQATGNLKGLKGTAHYVGKVNVK